MRPLLLFILLVVAGPASAEQRTNLTVVELFTSQGCSSCPPADALLGEIKGHDHVLALAFHVDYWNYLGWEDPLSASFATQRQVAYRDAMGGRYVYTPQFVVDGTDQFGLAHRADLLGSAEQPAEPGVALSWSREGLSLAPVSGGPEMGFVWLVSFEDHHSAEITAGENRGRTLTYHNPVTDMQLLGTWLGETTQLSLEAPETHGLAVLVTDAQGRIFAAADWQLD